ncbi:fimbrial protein [Stenotrophomonas rhizophila]|nr:fimbrial protein [Stenotrophomonas rhizophila]
MGCCRPPLPRRHIVAALTHHHQPVTEFITMSLNSHTTRLAAALGLLLASQASQAQDRLNVNVGGEFYNATCGFIVNGGADVDLGRVNINVFTGVGHIVRPWTSFDITSTGCSAGTTSVHMRWRGAVDPDAGRDFAVTGGATGVAVIIHSERPGVSSRVVPNGAAHTWAPGTASGDRYPHRASFIQTLPTITEGPASAAVTIDITYN